MQIPQPPSPPDPIAYFTSWMNEARQSEKEDPDAACLATVNADQMPDARMVLIRIVDERGFTFFTNTTSRKGQDLLQTPKAALCFHWKSLRRQVRVQGSVSLVSDAEADGYFNSRHRSSRIGAWASLQSSPLPDRETLEARVHYYEKEFEGIDNPPRPPHWTGFRIDPSRIEFWQQSEYRLHQRRVYQKENDSWTNELLYP